MKSPKSFFAGVKYRVKKTLKYCIEKNGFDMPNYSNYKQKYAPGERSDGFIIRTGRNNLLIYEVLFEF